MYRLKRLVKSITGKYVNDEEVEKLLKHVATYGVSPTVNEAIKRMEKLNKTSSPLEFANLPLLEHYCFYGCTAVDQLIRRLDGTGGDVRWGYLCKRTTNSFIPSPMHKKRIKLSSGNVLGGGGQSHACFCSTECMKKAVGVIKSNAHNDLFSCCPKCKNPPYGAPNGTTFYFMPVYDDVKIVVVNEREAEKYAVMNMK